MKLKEKTVVEELSGLKFKIRLVEPVNNQFAVITHEIQKNRNTNPYKFSKDTISYIEELLKNQYPNEEITQELAEDILQYLFVFKEEILFPAPENPTFEFIDLFAGIGGFRLALQNLGGKCVFTSEWDEHAKKTYRANFGETPFGDITKDETKKHIPESFDILCAGFPCQPFSSIGKRQGFLHATQGTLFNDILKIIKSKKIKSFLLENVGGLVTHDGGKTFKIIKAALEEAEFEIFDKILDASDFGVPQQRKRIYIVGFNKKLFGNENIEFKWPDKSLDKKYINLHLEKNVKGYSISKHLQEKYLFKKNDGRPIIINYDSMVQVKTLVSTYHKIQRLTGTFVKDGETGVRLLTEKECKAIMGFPEKFVIPVSRTQMYRQMGNSVAVPVIQAVAKEMLAALSNIK